MESWATFRGDWSATGSKLAIGCCSISPGCRTPAGATFPPSPAVRCFIICYDMSTTSWWMYLAAQLQERQRPLHRKSRNAVVGVEPRRRRRNLTSRGIIAKVQRITSLEYRPSFTWIFLFCGFRNARGRQSTTGQKSSTGLCHVQWQPQEPSPPPENLEAPEPSPSVRKEQPPPFLPLGIQLLELLRVFMRAPARAARTTTMSSSWFAPWPTVETTWCPGLLSFILQGANATNAA